MADPAPAAAAAIDRMAAAHPYNPELLPDLEQYVRHQVESRKWDLDTNLTLLRLYQFEPARLSVPVVTSILVKALMVLPRLDFSLCMFLVPEKLTAQFAKFWTEAAHSRGLLESDGLREYAIHVLSLTFQRVPRHVLAEAVNIDGPSLDKFLQDQVVAAGWTVEDTARGQVVVLPKNEENCPELKKFSSIDGIPLAHVSRVFPLFLRVQKVGVACEGNSNDDMYESELEANGGSDTHVRREGSGGKQGPTVENSEVEEVQEPLREERKEAAALHAWLAIVGDKYAACSRRRGCEVQRQHSLEHLALALKEQLAKGRRPVDKGSARCGHFLSLLKLTTSTHRSYCFTPGKTSTSLSPTNPSLPEDARRNGRAFSPMTRCSGPMRWCANGRCDGSTTFSVSISQP
eukprot:SM000036S13267  [mRNA]  locus=s36:249750:254445:- [translate_table: standard]